MPPCPCGSPSFDACCGPLLDGSAPAATAEALMRSRYSAFARGATDYLVETYDPETLQPGERAALAQSARETVWLGLEILATEAGREGDEQGVVEFRARYRRGGQARAHHERSRFRRVEGRWRYVDGEQPVPRPTTPVRAAPTAGRNDPCPCGSGVKYKKCHGAPGAA